MAQRVIAAYCTVSHIAATLLARTPPIHLLAAKQSRIFMRLREANRTGVLTPQIEYTIRQEEETGMHDAWLRHISEPSTEFGWRTREAILPVFREWLDRPHGLLTFRMTQLISGHGCFNEYLHRIGKSRVDSCFLCGDAPDTAQHVLQDCRAWEEERRGLMAVVGGDLSLTTLISRIVETTEAWEALRFFAETAMRARESEERRRQAEEAARRLQRASSYTDSEDEDYIPRRSSASQALFASSSSASSSSSSST